MGCGTGPAELLAQLRSLAPLVTDGGIAIEMPLVLQCG
jgi:hypothetical protein